MFAVLAKNQTGHLVLMAVKRGAEWTAFTYLPDGDLPTAGGCQSHPIRAECQAFHAWVRNDGNLPSAHLLRGRRLGFS